MRKNSKNPFKKSKLKADKLFSLLIRKVNTCELAGVDSIQCGGGFQCAHIIGRANFKLRWDTANAFCLCAGHHVYYTNHPWEWQELIREQYPDRYEYLNGLRNEMWDRDIEKVLEGFQGVE